MRTLATKQTAINQYNGLGNQLWDLSGQRPTLDLRFAEDRSLVDATTGLNLIDFTRASSATYVGSDGLIKTATTNLLLRSEELDDAPWVPIGTVTATLDSSQGTPIDGSPVYRVDFSTANEQWRQTLTFQAATYAASIYVKGTPGETIRLAIPGNIAITETLNGDWQRISVIGSVAAGTNYFSITTAAGATARTIYATAAQLEQSSTVGEYVKTTSTINSAARFDHDPVTGESLGLLVEESRTNLLLQSEDFSTTWTPINTTVSTNQTVAPDGLTTADKIVETATTTEHNIRQDTASQSAGTYTISIFAKAGERSNLQFVSTGVLGGFRANFDLANGVLGSVDVQLTASIRPYPGGWYRCIVTATSSTSGALRAQWNIVTSSTAARVESYAGDITKGLYLWGAQLEAGSFPTSYIPTTSSTVTRAADVASISGSNFSSWYRQDESSAFVDFTLNGVNTGNNFVYDFSDGTINEEIFLNYQDSGNARWVARVASVQVTQDQSGAGLPRVKHAFGMASNNYMAARDGILSTGSSQVGMPSITSLSLGVRFTNVAHSNGTIRRLTYWPQRLGNEVLQTITQ